MNEERLFEPHELFFSLTDPKGIIRYGNEVFTRISAFTEQELIGAPHNIIRHPDMPRSVFMLLWDYLNEGKTIAAYVKNLAQDGRYYWVMATVMPCRGGYLSVRLKPSSPLFEAVQQIYAETLALEKRLEQETGSRKQAMEESAKFLLAQVQKAGFDDYDHFMAEALTQELTARAKGMKESGYTLPETNPDCDNYNLIQLESSCRELSDMIRTLFNALDHFSRLERELSSKYQGVQQLGQSLHLLAINASVAASRLGTGGAVQAAVADALGTMSKQMETVIAKRATQLGTLEQACSELVFGVAVALFEAEVACDFAIELQSSSDNLHNAAVLESLETMVDELVSRCRKLLTGMEVLGTETRRTHREVSEMVKRFVEMKAIQINGKTEAAANRGDGNFSVLFDEVARLVDGGREDCDVLLELLASSTMKIRAFERIALPFQTELDKLPEQVAANRAARNASLVVGS